MEIQFNNFAYKPYLILASGGSRAIEKNISSAFEHYFADDKHSHNIRITAYYPCTTRIKVEFTDNEKPFRCYVSMSNYIIEEMFDVKKQKKIEREEESIACAPSA